MNDEKIGSLTPAAWLTANPHAPAPERLAVAFLDAMERRDLTKAQGYIGDGFRMAFPGGVYPERLEALVEGASSRYQWVAKHLRHVESYSSDAGDSEIVWVRGTLYGVNVHGVAFEDVRFVDRFSCKGGALLTQDVWNDLAELGVLELR